MTTFDKSLFPLTLAALLGCALIAGTFFAFSNFVMRALAAIPPEKGVAAMQSVNIVVLNPLFLTVFSGTALLCLLTILAGFLRWNHPGAIYLLAGGVLYIVGTFLVTIACNVPLNDALAPLKPESSEAAKLWGDYLTNWTMWNHVRTLAALTATASFALALYHQTGGQ